MSLKDEIVVAIDTRLAVDAVAAANRVLALLRERGRPMWCASILSDEWAADDEADATTARFLLIDLGEDTT